MKLIIILNPIRKKCVRMRSKKALYNVISNFVLQVIAVLYGFIVPKIIIDYFGSDVNGLITSITQFLAYITLLESGFGPVIKATLYKPIANKDSHKIASILKTAEKFFRRIALIFLLYIVVLCFVFPLITKTDFDTVFTVSLVAIIAVSIFAEYYFGMVYRLFLQAEQKTYIVSIIQIITYILSMIVVVVLALLGCNVLIIKFVAGLIFVIRPLAQNIYVKRKYNIDFSNVSNNYPIKQKWDGLAQHIAAVVHSNTDVMVLTFFTTLAEVSVYSVYYLVIAGVKKIVSSLINGLDASFGDMIAKKEVDNLRKKFSIYEMIFMLIITIVFVCTFLLITPFVKLYTNGVTDVDYVRPFFGYLIVASEFIWAIRTPYSSLTLAAGHFKETRRGAWVEAIVNIIISIILVHKFGLIGVAIGTIIAMLIRTVEFVYHANKYILKRSIWESVKKILITVVATIIIVLIMNFVNINASVGFGAWIVCALVTFLIASVITLLLFFLFYKKDFKAILGRIKRMIRKKK